MLNAIEQADSRCFCLLDTGANALVLPRKDDMLELKRTVYSPRWQRCTRNSSADSFIMAEEDYHIVAIDGASPLMPLSWLILLAGWSYVPEVKEGQAGCDHCLPERNGSDSCGEVKDALHR